MDLKSIHQSDSRFVQQCKYSTTVLLNAAIVLFLLPIAWHCVRTFTKHPTPSAVTFLYMVKKCLGIVSDELNDELKVELSPN